MEFGVQGKRRLKNNEMMKLVVGLSLEASKSCIRTLRVCLNSINNFSKKKQLKKTRNSLKQAR